MKAKEYAEMYNSSKDKTKILGDILKEFIVEVEVLRTSRNAQGLSAYKAIILELCQKWKSFANRVEGVNPNGLVKFLKSKNFPEQLLP